MMGISSIPHLYRNQPRNHKFNITISRTMSTSSNSRILYNIPTMSRYPVIWIS